MGNCVVVPTQCQKKTLELLHNGHLGIFRMSATVNTTNTSTTIEKL